MKNLVKVGVSNADIIKANQKEIIDSIIENKKKTRKEIADYFARESNNSNSFLNETFNMMLLQQLTIFTSFKNFSKSMGELISVGLNERLARLLKLEVSQLDQITEQFDKQSKLISKIETEQNIDMSEFRNNVNKEFLSFIVGADLKLEQNGIDTGFRENIEVEINDVKKNLSQVFKKEKDNQTFIGVMSLALKEAVGMGLSPDEKMKDIIMTNFYNKNEKESKEDNKENEKESKEDNLVSKITNSMKMKNSHKQK
jgi:hypothetical protein